MWAKRSAQVFHTKRYTVVIMPLRSHGRSRLSDSALRITLSPVHETSMSESKQPEAPTAPRNELATGETVAQKAPEEVGPEEVGGRGGADPTRYGDWEKNGRCIDF
jgi:hypothetical protein